MTSRQFDVAVIGGGIAGAIAALTARKAGRAVCCVVKAPGATALSSGAVDLVTEEEGGDAAAGPHEPPGPLAEALTFAKEALPGLALTGDPSGKKALVLPTVFGTWKSTLMAPATQAAGDLDAIGEGEVVVVRFVDVQGGVEHTGALLGRHALERFGVRGVAAREVQVEFGHFAHRAGVFEAAAALDAERDLCTRIGGRIAPHVAKGTRLALLEPVMGLKDPAGVVAAVGRAAGVRCAEMLSTVPSVPGRRWQEALDAALARACVEVVRGEVAGFDSADRAVTALRLSTGASVKAKTYVLATGRFVGGGIGRGDGRFRETVFSLPVQCVEMPSPNAAIGDLTGRRIADRHAAFTAGIRTDDSMRPAGATGGPAFDNLFAAGAVIGGYDTARGPSGIGLAILTGYLAGRGAA